MKRKIAASTLAVALAVGGLVWASPASANEGGPSEFGSCVPRDAIPAWTEDVPDIEHPAVYESVIDTPAVEEVSHTDYWYMPVNGEVGRWSHSDKGPFDTYDWTLYYRTDITQKHVDVEAAEATYKDVLVTEAYTEVTPDIEHPEVPGVTCPEGPRKVYVDAPTWVDECGVGNGHWVYEDTEKYTFKTWEFGHWSFITAVPEGPYWLHGNDVWKAKETNTETCYTSTTLAFPTFEDNCGTANDFAYLPQSEGVIYQWQDSEDGENLNILASFEPGYVLGEGLPDGWIGGEDGSILFQWTYQFTDEACETTTPPPAAPPTTPTTPVTLAATGGGDVAPLLPIAAGVITMLGAALMVWRRVRA